MTSTTPKRRRLRAAGITSVAVVSLAAGGLVSQSAGAAEGSGSKSASTRTATPPKPPSPAQEDARLAKALGVSQDKVEAARKAVRSAELDAAEKAGKLTAKQRDLIEQLRDTGLDVPLPPGVGGPGSDFDPDEVLAKELGVSKQKLQSARPKPPAGGPGKGGPKPPAPGKGGAPAPPSSGGTGTTGAAPTPPSGSGTTGAAPTPPSGTN